MRKTVLLLGSGTLVVLLTAGAAFAATIAGTPRGDVLRGTPKPDTIRGLGGNDHLYGYASKDRLYGGRGSDRLLGGRGNDKLHAGPGRFEISWGRVGDDVYFGETGADSLRELNEDGVVSGGNHVAYDGGGADDLDLEEGVDRYFAGDGDDTIISDETTSRVDTVDCGAGSDTVIPRRGSRIPAKRSRRTISQLIAKPWSYNETILGVEQPRAEARRRTKVGHSWPFPVVRWRAFLELCPGGFPEA